MRGPVFVVLFASCAALAPAAPVPTTEKQRIEKEWGKPKGGGEFALKGKELTIRAPLAPETGDDPEMPCTVRIVRGDFVAAVKLLDVTGPNEANRLPDIRNGTRAGLRAWGGDAGANLWLAQYHPLRVDGSTSDKVQGTFWAELFQSKAYSASYVGDPKDGRTSHLRVTRRGNQIAFSTSTDGTKWTEPLELRLRIVLPEELSVGVAVVPSKNRVVCATFADLTIEPLKPEPKK